MSSLKEDLTSQKKGLDDFFEVSRRVLLQMKNDISDRVESKGYIISSSDDNGRIRYVRPINKHLFIDDPAELASKYSDFCSCLNKIKSGARCYSAEEKQNLDSVLYTFQQAIGVGLDLKEEPNAAKKHVGNRFEELIRALFTELGYSNKHVVLNIAYDSKNKKDAYKCENDLVLSKGEKVLSDSSHLEENEVVVSVKTTSKDRLGKMFLDKLLLEKFSRHPVKYVGIFNNDVQRSKSTRVSFTLVSGLFMVYSNFLTELDGVYYLAPPPIALTDPFDKKIKTFSEFLTKDIFEIF